MKNILTRKTTLAEVTENYVINSKCKEINEEALKNNLKVRSVCSPNVEFIKQRTFWGCSALKKHLLQS